MCLEKLNIQKNMEFNDLDLTCNALRCLDSAS